MSLAVAEVLGLWREAERLLESIPEQSPDRALVEEEVDRLHDLYQRLTGTHVPPDLAVQISTDTVRDAMETLNAAKVRLAQG